jgi:imidazolonepropionase-like amidohydrolase
MAGGLSTLPSRSGCNIWATSQPPARSSWSLAVLIGGGLSLALSPSPSWAMDLPADTTLVLRAAALVDPREGAVVPDPVVVVHEGRIVAVGPSTTTAVPDAEPTRTIDLGGLTLLPGLIDAHVHLNLGSASSTPEMRARATLHAGFTTVQDLGGTEEGAIPLRDAIRAGEVQGPRVVAAGPWIGVTGGTCDFDGSQPAAGKIVGRVEEVLARGADVVKLCVTGWLSDALAHPDSVEIDSEELSRAIEAAHRAGRRAVAHAIGQVGARIAVEGGIDALVHAGFPDSTTVAQMASRGTVWIPTLQSFQGIPGAESLGENVTRASAYGVKLAFGTDAGVIPHGTNANEFEAMIRAGVPAAEALRAATLVAAELLGLASEIGSLEPGKSADVIAVEGNPLTDPSALGRVRFVMKEGRIIRGESIPTGNADGLN